MACIFGHKWNGCICKKCGATRNEGHNWSNGICNSCKIDCTHQWEKCKCTVCGMIRDEGHDWHGCKCSNCGATRDKKHSWDSTGSGICWICDKKCEHQWNGCKCTICGKIRDEGHDCDSCVGICKICKQKITGEHNWQDDTCTRCGKTKITVKMIDEMCEKNNTLNVSYKHVLNEYKNKTLWQLNLCFKGNNINEQRSIIKNLFIKFDLKDDLEKLKAVYGIAFTAIRASKDETVNWWAANIVRAIALEDELFDLEIFSGFPTGRTLLEKFLIASLMNCLLPDVTVKRVIGFLKSGNHPDADKYVQISKTFLEGWKPIAEDYVNDYWRSHTESERDSIEKSIMVSCRKMNDMSAVYLITDYISRIYISAQQRKQMGGGGIWMQTINLETGVRQTFEEATPDMLYQLGVRMLTNIGKNPKEFLQRAIKHDDINCIPNEPNSNYDNLVKDALSKMK